MNKFKFLFFLSFFQSVSAIEFYGSGFGDIPDGQGRCGQLGEPLAITFDVSGIAGIQSIELEMEMSHTYVGDLVVELEAPDLSRHVLFGKTGVFEGSCTGYASDLNGTYRFTDEASEHIFNNWWMVAALSDTLPNADYRTTMMGTEPDAGFPTSLAETFSEVADPNGTWTLYFYDSVSSDTGVVTDASLTINAIGGQISDGEASFSISPSGQGYNLQTDMDYLSRNEWHYRLAGDTKEYIFPVPDQAVYDGDTVVISWYDVDGKGFGADLTHVISQSGLDGDQAILSSTMVITNYNDAPIVVDLFSYADFDVNGSANDVGFLVNNDPSYIRQLDGPNFVEFRANNDNHFQIDDYSNIWALLINDQLDDLANTGGEGYGPADVETAFQWKGIFLPNSFSSYEARTTVAVNTIAPTP